MKASWSLILSLLFTLQLFGQNALREAERLSDQQQFVASSVQLLAFIDSHPERKYDLGRAWALHSYNLLCQGKGEEARTANDKSFNLRRQLRSPEICENYLLAAQIDMAAKRYGDALAAAEQGMQMLIENPRIYADLNFYAAKALYQMGRPEEAQEYFSTARDVVLIEVGANDRAYASLLYQWGLLQIKRRSYAEAFSLLATGYYSATDPLYRSRILITAWQAYKLAK